MKNFLFISIILYSSVLQAQAELKILTTILPKFMKVTIKK